MFDKSSKLVTKVLDNYKSATDKNFLFGRCYNIFDGKKIEVSETKAIDCSQKRQSLITAITIQGNS